MSAPAQKAVDRNYYRFAGKFDLAIQTRSGHSIGRDFHSLIIDRPENLFLALTVCHSKSELPHAAEKHQGVYKHIPWQFTISRNQQLGVDQVHFFAPIFSSFLVTRLVVLPCLKRAITQAGGFSLIGSAFRYRDKSFILFGEPGSGKTALLLSALEQEAGFLGDNELMLMPSGEICGIFDDIELRYLTARNSLLWDRLSFKTKRRLRLYHFMSRLTIGKVSLNVTIPVRDLDLKLAAKSASSHAVLVRLGGRDGKKSLPSNSFMESLARYEADYRRLFPNPFFTKQTLDHSFDSMKRFFSNCSIWSMPSGCPVDDLLVTE